MLRRIKPFFSNLIQCLILKAVRGINNNAGLGSCTHINHTVTVTAVNLTKILHQDLIGVLQHISFNSGFEVIYGIKDLLIKGRLEVDHVILNL